MRFSKFFFPVVLVLLICTAFPRPGYCEVSFTTKDQQYVDAYYEKLTQIKPPLPLPYSQKLSKATLVFQGESNELSNKIRDLRITQNDLYFFTIEHKRDFETLRKLQQDFHLKISEAKAMVVDLAAPKAFPPDLEQLVEDYKKETFTELTKMDEETKLWTDYVIDKGEGRYDKLDSYQEAYKQAFIDDALANSRANVLTMIMTASLVNQTDTAPRDLERFVSINDFDYRTKDYYFKGKLDTYLAMMKSQTLVAR